MPASDPSYSGVLYCGNVIRCLWRFRCAMVLCTVYVPKPLHLPCCVGRNMTWRLKARAQRCHLSLVAAGACTVFVFSFLLAWCRFSWVGAVNSGLGRFVCDLSHVRLRLVRVGIRMSIDYEFAVTGLGRWVWVPAMGVPSGVVLLVV
jgi:hypothetical protein